MEEVSDGAEVEVARGGGSIEGVGLAGVGGLVGGAGVAGGVRELQCVLGLGGGGVGEEEEEEGE